MLDVAFWNVENLFDPALNVGRGPSTPQELAAKINHLAAIINSFFPVGPPGLLGLCEVGDQTIFDQLASAINPNHIAIWVPAPQTSQTGLGFIANPSQVASLTLLTMQKPSIGSRPRSLVVECGVVGQTQPVYAVLNHWKSRLQSGSDPTADDRDRLESARWLGDYLADNLNATDLVIVGGDFNAEPFEPPFSEVGLRGMRHFSRVLWSQSSAAYLYNCGWRFLAEPDTWNVAGGDGYREPKPKTTHGDSSGIVFDHILVSKRLLRGGPLTLDEASVRLNTNPAAVLRTHNSLLQPAKWSYNSASGTGTGASDHFAILASFR